MIHSLITFPTVQQRLMFSLIFAALFDLLVPSEAIKDVILKALE